MKNFISKNIAVLLIGAFVLFSASTKMMPTTEVGKTIVDSSVSGTYTIECDMMPIVWTDLTIVGNTTIKLNGTKVGQSIFLCLQNDGVGGHVITLDLGEFEMVGGTQPGHSTVANEQNNFVLMGKSNGNGAHEHARALGVK